MISFDKFEEELYRRVSQHKHIFDGKRTHTQYDIQHVSSSKTRGWSLFVNNRPVKTQTSFFSVACEIWDREVGENE